MVKFTIVSLAVAAAIPLAAGRTCLDGLRYCGHTLLEIGDYQAEMNAQIEESRACSEKNVTDQFLWYCKMGEVLLLGDCAGGCSNQGWGNSDFCKPDWKAAVRCDPWGGGPGGHWAWADKDKSS
ncbi:hypothetical protein CDD83_6815 [Cordyceps sp. RAO-2017]|nr:hypothetical protein CDD83_6815 [Cordyceps sp. RAO-2017]